jgi:hypothetical protein
MSVSAANVGKASAGDALITTDTEHAVNYLCDTQLGGSWIFLSK